MKKILAMFLLAVGLSAGAQASTTQLIVPQGFNGGSYSGFTFSGNWLSLGDPIGIISFYEGASSTLTYNSGSFDFTGFSLNGRPWNGYNDHFPVDLPGNPDMTMTFKDINGNTLATGSINLAASDNFVTFSQNVKGVHSIEFSAQASQFFVRVASVSMVPEAETYAMMLAGLALLGAIRRKAK
jgi:hypothetical protein